MPITAAELEIHAFGATAWATDGRIGTLLRWALFLADAAGGFVGHLRLPEGPAFLALVPGPRPGRPTAPGRDFIREAAGGSPELARMLTEASVVLSGASASREMAEASFTAGSVRLDFARGLHVAAREGEPRAASPGSPLRHSPPLPGSTARRIGSMGGGTGMAVSVALDGSCLVAGRFPTEEGERSPARLEGGRLHLPGLAPKEWPSGVPVPSDGPVRTVRTA